MYAYDMHMYAYDTPMARIFTPTAHKFMPMKLVPGVTKGRARPLARLTRNFWVTYWHAWHAYNMPITHIGVS